MITLMSFSDTVSSSGDSFRLSLSSLTYSWSLGFSSCDQFPASIVPPVSIISVHSCSTYRSGSVIDLLSINSYWSGLKSLFSHICLIISSRISDSIILHTTLVRLTSL